MTATTITKGQRVRNTEYKPPHIGVVEATRCIKRTNYVWEAYVRWHKGYASWVRFSALEVF